MIAGIIEGANHVFGKPSDMTDGECRALHVRVEQTRYSGGLARQFTSAWLPTPAELKRLNEGAAVHLTVIGEGHPPISLSVGTNEL